MKSLKSLLRTLNPTTNKAMAWRSSGNTNATLIENLYTNKLIRSPLILQAMKSVDRAHYCPNPQTAYQDSPQSIGHSATISAPHMHASACESLLPYLSPPASAPQRPVRVLDVGSGSGYLTHVLAELVFGGAGGDGDGNVGRERQGEVVGVEHISALRDLGEGNMRKSERGRELLDSGKVKFVVGDGRLGWKEGGDGFDAIHVGAGAKKIHEELVEQLRRPGRMFIPVDDVEGGGGGGGQHIWVVDKDVEGKIKMERLYGVLYVPLTDAPKY